MDIKFWIRIACDADAPKGLRKLASKILGSVKNIKILVGKEV